MRDGEHFGKIPGCGDKPTLLKPGAEKLCLTFRLAPAYAIEEKQHEGQHREYKVLATLSSILSGAFVGQGVGVCSTLEGKYRFRVGAGEPTDQPVPRSYWDLRQEDPAKAQQLIGGKGFSTRKIEGKGWMICKGGEKVEHDNPADHYNTVLKMAKKRALVDAVLTATAASDIFTQDLEDISANIAANTAAPVAMHPEQPAAPQPSAPAAKRAPARASVPNDLGQRNDADEYRRQSEGDVDEPDGDLPQIHFGKNRGLMWSELTANQRSWYQDEWAKGAKKKNPALLSAEDCTLLVMLDEMVAGLRDPHTGKRNAVEVESEVVK